jgi:hypothetical protein
VGQLQELLRTGELVEVVAGVHSSIQSIKNRGRNGHAGRRQASLALLKHEESTHHLLVSMRCKGEELQQKAAHILAW